MYSFRLGGALAAALLALPALAEPVPRPDPNAGAVIAVKSGEEITFVEAPGWRGVDPTQVVLSGDTLRTNALGQLAILFADRTQVRIGRNTTLVVKDVRANGDARLQLQQGAIWARAARGGAGVTVETPAAAAAVRGTDWSLTVAPDGRTALIVLEGAVELFNPQGSVLVREGEAATAAIGEAPTKVVLVRPKDREQMQFYVSLRGAFSFLYPSTLPSRRAVAEHRRIAAVPASLRTAEDLVLDAELTLSLDGPKAAEAAIAAARRARLTPAQSARVDLVEGLALGSRTRYAEAAALLQRAQPRLDPERRGVAAYSAYIARSLANPSRAEPPPPVRGGGPNTALAEAYLDAFVNGTPAAIARLEAAERRHPDEALLPAVRAQLALLEGDREGMKAAVERAVALDPDNPVVLLARAHYRAEFERDLKGAEADLLRARELQPGSTSVWDALGMLYAERDDSHQAEAAYLKAIELEPEDALPYANLALIYLDQNRLDDAKAAIDKALALDPSLHVAYTALGRWHLQRGENDLALQNLLKGSTANPAASNALLLLAAASYQTGDAEAGRQAIDNAARLDPFDPLAPVFATKLALDEYRADDAIRSARESVRLARGRGGDFASLAASREEGSTVAEAFRFLDLDAWGRYYSAAVFDPFEAGGYIDQSIIGTTDPVFDAPTYDGTQPSFGSGTKAFSNLVQGLALDPLAVASPRRRVQIVRAPFVEASGGGGFIVRDESNGKIGFAEVQGYSNAPIPVSFVANVERRLTDDTDGITTVGEGGLTGTVILGAEPSPDDRIIAMGILSDNDTPYVGPDTDRNPFNGRQATVGQGVLAWSHTFAHRNVLTTAVSATTAEQRTRQFGLVPFGGGSLLARDTTDEDSDTLVGSIAHAVGFGPVTVRYGADAGILKTTRSIGRAIYVPDPVEISEGRVDAEYRLGRAFLDVLAKPTDDIGLEAAVFGTLLDGEGTDISRLEPRIGASWSFFEGHSVRAMAARETTLPTLVTLSPVGVLGLEANEPSVGVGGQVDTVAVRWDAEWTERFFTSVEYQHQDLDGVSLTVPGSLTGIALENGSIDRVALTANAWIGGGFGAFATVAYARSDNGLDAPGFDDAIPFVPDMAARAGITYAHPSRVRATLSSTYVGERSGDLAGTELDPYVTLDANVTWEPLDRRFQLDLSVYNILDEDFDVAPDTPGWGRTVVGRVAVRF
ncbi:TonB-dependent receptor domain-containing protein [Chthonobacter rhizosphaerae]|uniref:TonB-dependent receptor domain-containing protein n=1 Tax=Chthonobacter rhizosphaerae TaxID=2735553 RepID=UPI0015EE9581|nr:TonB-dependent receptor [Chthonobacter rhizosphaerae]